MVEKNESQNTELLSEQKNKIWNDFIDTNKEIEIKEGEWVIWITSVLDPEFEKKLSCAVAKIVKTENGYCLHIHDGNNISISQDYPNKDELKEEIERHRKIIMKNPERYTLI